MTSIDRGSTWSSYVLVTTNEVALKPTGLGREEAAELPLCAQTAYEALFVHAGLQLPLLGRCALTEPQCYQEQDHQHAWQLGERVLGTGAAGGGGGGVFLVQLAAHTEMHVVRAGESVARLGRFDGVGDEEVIEYAEFVGRPPGSV
ncbi:Alcohol dehydrogenase superfamily, zinc-type [Penicillium roqueforti FM164]|uniref:Alcohol dehydrogenase superfamily, zinc-type n=1 Tax=Penicillium roqueforti (strain FM164) TaxID=1365484 RepID=W6QWE2_PENRF|nr:Alcohol dehydrogenase superfamily, zinc-type [Penicillium roqueforti FM164]